MFVLLPIIRWLAHDSRAWVVVASGALLVVGGASVSVLGITTHQPAITRIGFIILIIAVIYTVAAVRGRRSRTREDADRDHDRHEDRRVEQA